MTDTYVLDRANAARLTEAVARHYGSINTLAITVNDDTSTLSVAVNGGDSVSVAYTERASDPVDRLLELRSQYFNGGRDSVSLDEVMGLLEPAHSQLTG